MRHGRGRRIENGEEEGAENGSASGVIAEAKGCLRRVGIESGSGALLKERR